MNKRLHGIGTHTAGPRRCRQIKKQHVESMCVLRNNHPQHIFKIPQPLSVLCCVCRRPNPKPYLKPARNNASVYTESLNNAIHSSHLLCVKSCRQSAVRSSFARRPENWQQIVDQLLEILGGSDNLLQEAGSNTLRMLQKSPLEFSRPPSVNPIRS